MPRTKEFDPDQALDRAMQLFWRKGYEATSVQNLVDQMGINRFSLYSTFGSKHDLFLAALDRYRDEVVTDGVSMLEGPEVGISAIRCYFESAAEMAATSKGRRSGCLMTNAAVEVAPHDKEAAARIEAHLERLENAFYRQLRNARKEGELKAGQSLRDLARFLTGAAQGLGVMVTAGKERRALARYVAVVLAALE
ncbi:MAG: TetR family transcriptional regulator [Gemmatimonadota bacterium]